MTREATIRNERDATINLFLECEAKRREAFAQQKSAEEAHEEARSHWNKEVPKLRTVNFTNVRFETAASLREKRVERLPRQRRLGGSLREIRHVFDDLEPPAKSVHVCGPDINFRGFEFPCEVTFAGATFTRDTHFDRTHFRGYANFARTTFNCDVWFDLVIFSGFADFYAAQFKGDAVFWQAEFRLRTEFYLANFSGNTEFGRTRFRGEARFRAIRVERAFNITKATFEMLPDFVQAHFEEPPRLDDLLVEPRYRTLKDRLKSSPETPNANEKAPRSEENRAGKEKRFDPPSIAAQWRALRRLAVAGHDLDRELEFHARELRSQRRSEDGAWPRLFCRRPAVYTQGEILVTSCHNSCGSFGRFWFGLLYDIFSNCGRSLFRPFLFWAMLIVFCAVFFASWSRSLVPQSGIADTVGGKFTSSIADGWNELLPGTGRQCYWSKEISSNSPSAPQGGTFSKEVSDKTNLGREAWLLSFRNALVVLDTSGDAAQHRTYGCLYGVELYGSSPIAVVPSMVSFVSSVQKLLSSVMIFLFVLALRNMLKMK